MTKSLLRFIQWSKVIWNNLWRLYLFSIKNKIVIVIGCILYTVIKDFRWICFGRWLSGKLRDKKCRTIVQNLAVTQLYSIRLKTENLLIFKGHLNFILQTWNCTNLHCYTGVNILINFKLEVNLIRVPEWS